MLRCICANRIHARPDPRPCAPLTLTCPEASANEMEPRAVWANRPGLSCTKTFQGSPFLPFPSMFDAHLRIILAISVISLAHAILFPVLIGMNGRRSMAIF